MADPAQVTVEDEDSQRIYRLVVGGKIVSTARTLESILLTIGTVAEERGKGYATTLLHHIEEGARSRGAKSLQTSDIDSDDVAAVGFFKQNGYVLEPIPGQDGFLEGTRSLV